MNTSKQQPTPEWLSLYCGNTSLEELEMWFAAAAEHGFTEVQPSMCWSPLTAADFKAIKAMLEKYGLRARCIGIYNDLYKWEGPLQWTNTSEDLRTAIAHAPSCGAETLVCWSGSASTDLLESKDAVNHSPEALTQLHANAKRLLPELESNAVTLLFEPWRSHVLANEHATAEFCAQYRGRFGVVLDPPNFIHPDDWSQRSERLQSIYKTLSDYIGIVHLKDMTVDEDGGFELPMFGQGGMDPVEVLRTVSPCFGKVPVVVEHVATPSNIPIVLENINTALAKL